MPESDFQNLPFYKIEEPPIDFRPGHLIQRLIDGLGYRFYWATENLNQVDLEYQPSESGKSTFETLQHIYNLSETILNVACKEPNVRPYEDKNLSFALLREMTLQNLHKAKQMFDQVTETEIGDFKVIFKFPDKEIEYPFWNFLNGQLMDAIYHVGQIVTFRRSSGNPMSEKVRVFTGENVG